jgi:hypothetical protein
MKNKDISTLIGPIIQGFQRYSLTIFIVVLTSGLVVTVLIMNSIVQKSSDTSGYTSTTNMTSFDQVTIDRVKQLHTSDAQTDITLPPGRINPFAE